MKLDRRKDARKTIRRAVELFRGLAGPDTPRQLNEALHVEADQLTEILDDLGMADDATKVRRLRAEMRQTSTPPTPS